MNEPVKNNGMFVWNSNCSHPAQLVHCMHADHHGLVYLMDSQLIAGTRAPSGTCKWCLINIHSNKGAVLLKAQSWYRC